MFILVIFVKNIDDINELIVGSKKNKNSLTLGGRLYPRFFNFREFGKDFEFFSHFFLTFSYFANNAIVSKP